MSLNKQGNNFNFLKEIFFFLLIFIYIAFYFEKKK